MLPCGSQVGDHEQVIHVEPLTQGDKGDEATMKPAYWQPFEAGCNRESILHLTPAGN